jgi:hypothetical protein
LSVNGIEPQENPYRVSKAAAKARDDASAGRSTGVLIVASIEAFVGVMAGWRAPPTIGGFEELFKGFGADLPGLTRFVLDTRYGWWIFAIAAISILAWIVKRPATTRVEKRRQMFAVIAYAVAFGVAYGLTVVALYIPIFKLGAAI